MADTDGPWTDYQSDQASGPWDDYASQAPSSNSATPWSDVAVGAVENLPSSALNLGKNIAGAILSPVQTAKGLYGVAKGADKELGEKIGLYKPTDSTPDQDQFEAVKKFYADRYGSEEGFKQALMNDPVGVMADASMFIGGAGNAAARIPGVIGKVGTAAKTAGEIVNPVSAAGKIAAKSSSLIGNGAAHIIGGLFTHTGADPLKLAYQAGKAGGQLADDFVNSMTGDTDATEVVQTAKNAISQLRDQRAQDYRSGMSEVTAKTVKQQEENKAYQQQYNARAQDTGGIPDIEPPAIMSFDPIDAALTKSNKIKNFQGVDIQKSTADVRSKISDLISNWKNMDPHTFHTAEGFDALKQAIGDLGTDDRPGSPQSVVVNTAYNAVKKAIVDQDPKYAAVMKDYSNASDIIKQIENELSLNPKANVGTSLRKLQSIMRNNVNTNYGYRQKLADILTQNGAPNLPTQLAGQALNKWTPRGLGGVEAGATAIGGLFAGQPGMLAALPFMSPRLMGSAAYGAGRAASAVPSAFNRIPLSVRSRLPSLSSAALGTYGASIPQQSYLPGN